MYTDWQHNYGAIPLSFTPLANSLLLQSHSSLTYLETLLGVIRSRPPWPQVTCKLTSPFPSPPHSLPIPNSQHLRSIVLLTKTTSWSRLLMVRNNHTYSSHNFLHLLSKAWLLCLFLWKIVFLCCLFVKLQEHTHSNLHEKLTVGLGQGEGTESVLMHTLELLEAFENFEGVTPCCLSFYIL